MQPKVLPLPRHWEEDNRALRVPLILAHKVVVLPNNIPVPSGRKDGNLLMPG